MWNDKNNWEEKLKKTIKHYNSVSIIFIDNNGLYNNHIENLNLPVIQI